MQNDKKQCHGQFESLASCSASLNLKVLRKSLWNLRAAISHFMWHYKTKGLPNTLQLTLHKALGLVGMEEKRKLNYHAEGKQAVCNEILNLKPGELVEVKSEEEIFVTLDENRRHRGLCWMANMRKFCGKRYRVFKRLDTILLESTGEPRKTKNTVLLEDVICDGKEFYGCDRSCFHYWREAWLKRAK